MNARAAPLAVLLSALSAPTQALIIDFDYRYDTRGFFTDPTTGAARDDRRAVLEYAATFYAGFDDALAAIVPGVGDHWSVKFTHPSLAGPVVTLLDEVIPANTLRVFVGGSPSAPGVLGFAGSGFELAASGADGFVANVFTRGQGVTQGVDASDYGPWGGYLWLNASHDWYTDLDPVGLTPDRPDMLTTVIHELGHILGIGEADAWHAWSADGEFHGPASMTAYGGPVPLDPLSLHWAEGVFSSVAGSAQETLMDPTTPRGLRELPTALDNAGLVDIGWTPTPVPLPAPWLLSVSAAVLVARRARANPRDRRHG